MGREERLQMVPVLCYPKRMARNSYIMNPVQIVVAQTLTAATLTDMLIALYATIMNLERVTLNSTIINRKREQCSKVHPLL